MPNPHPDDRCGICRRSPAECELFNHAFQPTMCQALEYNQGRCAAGCACPAARPPLVNNGNSYIGMGKNPLDILRTGGEVDWSRVFGSGYWPHMTDTEVEALRGT